MPFTQCDNDGCEKMQNNDQNELEMAKNSLAYDINQGWMDY